MINSDEHFFSLNVIKADSSSMIYRFALEATIGSDPRNDIILIGGHISTKHLHFKNNEHCLTLTFLGQNQTSSINNSPLEKNKMYIVEKKDSIQIGLTKIIVL
jgi:hypothetical protein